MSDCTKFTETQGDSGPKQPSCVCMSMFVKIYTNLGGKNSLGTKSIERSNKKLLHKQCLADLPHRKYRIIKGGFFILNWQN